MENKIEQLQILLCTIVLYPKQQESLAREIYYDYIKPLEDENLRLKQEVLSFENLNLEKLIIIQDKDAKIEQLHKQLYKLL